MWSYIVKNFLVDTINSSNPFFSSEILEIFLIRTNVPNQTYSVWPDGNVQVNIVAKTPPCAFFFVIFLATRKAEALLANDLIILGTWLCEHLQG